jgi:DNA-binding MarR family transcriptional regulator
MPIASDDIVALAEALRPALLRLSRHLRRAAQRAGASALDVQLLAAIRKHPGVGGAELADREQISRPAMSAHLKRLQAAGWIERDPSPHADRRRVALRLTAAGGQALEAVRRGRNDWLIARLERLSDADRARLGPAADALTRLADPA